VPFPSWPKAAIAAANKNDFAQLKHRFSNGPSLCGARCPAEVCRATEHAPVAHGHESAERVATERVCAEGIPLRRCAGDVASARIAGPRASRASLSIASEFGGDMLIGR